MELSSHPLAQLLAKQGNVSTSPPLQRNQQHTLATDTALWCMQVPLRPSRAAGRDVCRTVETWHHPCFSRNWRLSHADCVRKSGQAGEVRKATHVSICRVTLLAGASPVLQCFIHPNSGDSNKNIYNTEEETPAMFWIFECILILYMHFNSSSVQVLLLIYTDPDYNYRQCAANSTDNLFITVPSMF